MINFVVNKEKCTKCRQCVKDCPREIISMGKDFPFISLDNEKICLQCQHCLAVCPTAALSILGFNPKNSLEIKENFPTPKEMKMLIKGRRSTRSFKKENLDRSDIMYLVDTASYAPTGNNAMGICFTVIDDYKKMDIFKEHAMNKLRTFINEKKLPQQFKYFERIMEQWDNNKRDVLFWDAPHMVVASCPKDYLIPVEDSMIALTNFEMLANCMGLGTLWLGLVKRLMVHFAPELIEILNIPKDHVIGYVMCFGKPAVKFYRTVQRKPKQVSFPELR